MTQDEAGLEELLPKPTSAYIDRERFRAEIRMIPNLISIGRVLLVVPIGLLYPNQSWVAFWTMLVLLLLSYLSDYADGFIARRLNQRTRLGLILDPVADKVWTAAMIYLLYRYRGLPAWIMLVIIGRDIVILTINFILLRSRGVVMSSDNAGRVYLVLLGLMIIGATLRIPGALVLAHVLVLLAFATMYRYLRRVRRMMLTAGFTGVDPRSAPAGDD